MAGDKKENRICTSSCSWKKVCNYHDNIIQVSRSNNNKPTNTDQKQNENLSKSPSGETIINEKEEEKDTVNQNSIESIKGNENAEKKHKIH